VQPPELKGFMDKKLSSEFRLLLKMNNRLSAISAAQIYKYSTIYLSMNIPYDLITLSIFFPTPCSQIKR
jgi:hypothetical protein